jgi:hypothetical protein
VEVIDLLEWKDKVDGDDILAEDINAIAHQAIENAEAIGDVEIALDTIIAEQETIIAIQNQLIGGGSK